MCKIKMKKVFMIVGLLITLAGGIWYFIYKFQNPDMTDARLFISNPYPSVMCVLGWSIEIVTAGIK